MKPTIYAFDFDGTLTTCDTLLEFIRFAKGNAQFLLGFSLFSPLILLMKLHLMENWRVKQWLFSWFFKGCREEQFNDACERFADKRRNLIRLKGKQCMEEAVANGYVVVVVSASVDNWVRPFFKELPVEILGTQIEKQDNRLTGRFKTRNCYGPEKVNRLLARFPDREEYTLVAFGDSKGDSEMLAFADESHYKPFR